MLIRSLVSSRWFRAFLHRSNKKANAQARRKTHRDWQRIGSSPVESLEIRTMLSAGALDTTFGGGDGIVETPIGLRAKAKAVDIDSQGRIVAVGGALFLGPDRDGFAVARYLSDGSLDTSFNGTGIQFTTVSSLASNMASGVAIQSDDKIVVTGTVLGADSLSWDFAVVRYNVDGSLDTTFGNGGIVTTTFSSGSAATNDFANAIAIDGNGRIVVVGDSSGGNSADVVVARYNTDGSLDTSFDGDGRMTLSYGPADDYGQSVAIHDGQILVAGQTRTSTSYGTAVARLNDDGSLDSNFGTLGVAKLLVHQGDAGGLGIAVQPDGKIVTCGFGVNSGNPFNQFEVARFNSDGTPDTGFGNNGAVLTEILPGYSCIAWSVAIQQNGKIVVGGDALRIDDTQTVVVRYNPDGTLDSTFDGDGKAITDHGTAINLVPGYPLRAMALQADGKIVVAGYLWYSELIPNPNQFFLVLRYEGDPVIPPNSAPVANDDSVTTDEDSAITFDVLGNDADSENNLVASSTINLTSPLVGLLTNNGNGTFSYDPGSAFQYLAVGESATVTFDYRVFDAFGEHDDGTVTITINGANDTPSVSVANASVAVNEGQSASNSGWWSDIDASDVVTLNATVGSVTRNADGTWSWSFNTNDGPDQSQTVTVTATDLSGAVSNTTFQLSVNNVAPDAAVSGPVSTLAGTAVNFTLGATDISSADQAAGFTYQIDWDGDGFVDQTVAGANGLVVGHSFASAGLTNVIVTATDKDGGTSSPVTHSILVIQPVNIDVKPDSSQNKVNVKSQGVIPVAILTTAGFDATTVIGSSVQLVGVSASHFALEDVDRDGDLDLILHFRTQDVLDALGLSLNSGDSVNVNVQLTGETIDQVMIEGLDTINFFLTGHGSGKNK